ncbi:Hypothetical protein Cp3995_1035 [Corynebacterium pseudotuberculosis 3/99-5]|nr:Hypothetical protein Cp3995_1035 [Corynebacterium pseudotuberculosis 3/99-5]
MALSTFGRVISRVLRSAVAEVVDGLIITLLIHRYPSR